MENQMNQLIIMNKNPADASLQIVIPPFRPINLFELEDDFESVTHEIQRNIFDQKLANYIIDFVTAFRDAMEEADVLPIVEFFLTGDETAMNPDQIKSIFETIKEFVELVNNEERLMH
ncbi:hypothetical protein [Erysipelothrix anatis]|uniref:hypothetical protein n=1 Tax=Erysipelothrix anatis TaxID=2683713 RepID=UPI001358340D|nr:hypothetical protein [Erysipelothrix anatis]